MIRHQTTPKEFRVFRGPILLQEFRQATRLPCNGCKSCMSQHQSRHSTEALASLSAVEREVSVVE